MIKYFTKTAFGKQISIQRRQKNIGEIGDNTLLGIVLVLIFATLYLLMKEFKKRKK